MNPDELEQALAKIRGQAPAPAGDDDIDAALARVRGGATLSPGHSKFTPAQLVARANNAVETTVRQKVSAALLSGYNAASFGLGPKLLAAQRAVSPKWLGGTDYNTALTEQRGEIDRFRDDHPYANATAEAIGGTVPALLSGGTSALAQAPVRTALRQGAAYGAAQGVGQPDNPTPEQAIRGGAAGAAVGAGGMWGMGKLAGAATRLATRMERTGSRPFVSSATEPAATGVGPSNGPGLMDFILSPKRSALRLIVQGMEGAGALHTPPVASPAASRGTAPARRPIPFQRPVRPRARPSAEPSAPQAAPESTTPAPAATREEAHSALQKLLGNALEEGGAAQWTPSAMAARKGVPLDPSDTDPAVLAALKSSLLRAQSARATPRP